MSSVFLFFPFVNYVVLITAILMAVKWYHIVVFLCVSLTANDAEQLFMLFVCLIGRKVCLSPSPILNLGCLSLCS